MNNNKNYLVYLLKDSSSLEIYIISWRNKLLKISCPFFVRALCTVGDVFEGQKVTVQQIKLTSTMTTVYIIEQKPYYYYHFHIISE